MATELPPVTIRFLATNTDSVKGAVNDIANMIASLEQRLDKLSSKQKAVFTSTSNSMKNAIDIVSKSQANANAKQVTDFQKAEKDKQKAAEKSARELERINQRLNKDLERHARESTRIHERELKKQEKDAEASAKRVEASRKRVLGSVTGVASTAAKGVVGLLTGTTAFAGADAARERLQNERVAAQLSNASTEYDSNGKRIKSVSQESLLKAAEDNARRFGTSSSGNLEAIGKIQAATGNTQLGIDVLPELSKLSLATGADLGDLSNLVASFNASNKGFSPDQILGLVRASAGLGKSGNAELKDLAAPLARLAGPAASYGGSHAENIRTSGALLEETNASANSPDAARTYVQDYFLGITKHESQLKSLGVATRDKEGNKLSQKQIVQNYEEAVSSGRISDKQNIKILGIQGLNVSTRIQSQRKAEIDRLKDEDRATLRAQGKSDADIEKQISKTNYTDKTKNFVADMFARYERTPLTKQNVEDEADAVMKTKAQQVAVAMERFKGALGERIVPVLDKIIPILPKLADAIMFVIDQLVNHPWRSALLGVGALVGKALAQEMAAAAIAKTIQGSMASGISAIGPALIVALAALSVQQGMKGIDDASKGQSDRESKQISLRENVRSLVRKRDSVGLTKDEQDELSKSRVELTDMYNRGSKSAAQLAKEGYSDAGGGIAGLVGGFYAGVTGGPNKDNQDETLQVLREAAKTDNDTLKRVDEKLGRIVTNTAESSKSDVSGAPKP